MIVLFRVFPVDERGRAMALYGFGIVLAPAIGPAIGGALLEAFGWRSIFLLTVPFCIAGLVLGATTLPRHAGRTSARFDWLGWGLLLGAARRAAERAGRRPSRRLRDVELDRAGAGGMRARCRVRRLGDARTRTAPADPPVPPPAVRRCVDRRLRLWRGAVRHDVSRPGVRAGHRALQRSRCRLPAGAARASRSRSRSRSADG